MNTATTKPVLIVLLAFVAILLLGNILMRSVNVGKESPAGFVLPLGDAEQGKQAFVELSCVNCHSVEGVVFADVPMDQPKPFVALGGEKAKVTTYGQLVTAIIHPSEGILDQNPYFADPEGASLMPNLRETMTVQQMADLVSFLTEHYSVRIPDYESMYYHGYPAY